MVSPLTHPLPLEKLRALVRAISEFPVLTRERGKHYAANGRVGHLRLDATVTSAAVRGTEVYDTLWTWVDGDWIPECDCPVGPYCKHAYALACHMLGGAESQLADRRLVRLLPNRLTLGSFGGDPPQRRSARAEATPAVRLAAPAILDRLRSARDAWARQHLLAELVPRDVGSRFNLYMPPFPEILEEPDAELMCWRLAQEISKRTAGWLPRPLEVYRDRTDLAARMAERARTALASELVAWARRQHATVPRRLRLLFALVLDTAGDPCVTVEARLTTPRLSDKPRNLAQLQQLRVEVRRNPRLLSPEEGVLLEWLVDHSVGGPSPFGFEPAASRRLTGTRLKALLAQVADSPLAEWSSELDAGLAARAEVQAGARLQVSTVPARLLPTCVSRDGTTWVDFIFFWPDGHQRPRSEVVYLRQRSEYTAPEPSFIVADGAFTLVIEEPPRSLLSRLGEAGGLPLAAEEQRPMLELLATNFPHLHDTLASRTRFYQVKGVLALDLREDDWMQIRLFGYAGSTVWTPGSPVPADAVLFEYTPDNRWTRHTVAPTGDAADEGGRALPLLIDDDCVTAVGTTGPAADRTGAEQDIWLEAPERSCVEPATRWLASLPANPGDTRNPGGRHPVWGDRSDGWWMQASRTSMEMLAAAWDERPRVVAFFASERLHRLLSGSVRVKPLLRVESSGLDWFAVSAEWASEVLRLSDADLAKLRSAATRFVKLSAGWVRKDIATEHDETAELLADLGLEAGQGEQRLSVWQLAGARPESLRALERLAGDPQAVAAARELRQRVAAFTAVPSVHPPDDLHAVLRPYQQHGLDFLAYTSALGIGAVLADDMGLGKTVQALAWLVHLRELEPQGGPTLVVCPASVVHNWAREAERFTPGLRVLLLTRGKSRHQLREEIPGHDVVVTNYALLRRDLEEWRKIEWRAVILDEAQNIKNPNAVVTRAAQTLQARHRLALTGTPLENRALDLWSIMSFVNPGYLGTRAQFEARFDRLDPPLHVRTLLAAKLRPVLLRRTKSEAAPDLPDRIEERRDCELSKEQRLLYVAELRRSRALVEDLSAAPGGLKQNKIHILAALTRLRQICCHPALAGGKRSLASGKFDAIFELLEPLLAEGHKVLVFSQFVECLKLLQAEMRLRSITTHMLTGQTTKRKEVVEAFQDDPQPCVFLISLKAGGTGLNLTAASYVVLFDPWWNPAVEAQAIDRTHRIGQDRTVIAYRLLAVGTVEEKIWQLQQHKAALARDVLGEGSFARALTREDLEYLLTET